jgi:hypothetical protein
MTMLGQPGPEVFSPRRARQLRDALIVSLVVDAYLIAVVVIEASGGNTGRAVSIGVPTATLVGYSIACLSQLRYRRRIAKVLCAMTGSLLIVVGLVLVSTLFGLIPIILGIAVLVLSLRQERNRE